MSILWLSTSFLLIFVRLGSVGAFVSPFFLSFRGNHVRRGGADETGCIASLLGVDTFRRSVFGATASSDDFDVTTKTESEEEPANNMLRQKIRASRPLLGHVIRGGSSNPRTRSQGKPRQQGLNNPGMLKITAGTAKGRRLDSPDVYLRPMMGKVREAVFSAWTSFGLYDSSISVKHLDLFSGSGSVGLESLSRGASHCTFVDLSSNCCSCVERNVALCNFDKPSRATVLCKDAMEVLRDPFRSGIPMGQLFQIVSICPPYEEVVYADLLEGVANCPCVTEDTLVLIEYPVELGCLPHVVKRKDGGAMIGVRNRRYGRTVVAMYVVNPTGRLDAAESRPEEFVAVR